MKTSLYKHLPKSHFFGMKLRNRRKSFGLTLEDLMNRCIEIDATNAPSVSYLSLLETGRRPPTAKLIEIFSKVFNESPPWFLDDSVGIDLDLVNGETPRSFQLEPGSLFDKSILARAIPEILTRTGISGRKFAYTLIGSLCEKQKYRFPDLEKEAVALGNNKFPMNLDTIYELCKKVGLKIKWFDNPLVSVMMEESGESVKSHVRSFFKAPDTIYINQSLKNNIARLKFEIALRLGHIVLHGGDGVVSDHATGGELGASPQGQPPPTFVQYQKDILVAWRDFECSYFASALILPQRPFKRFAIRTKYDIFKAVQMDYTLATVMRRMTSISPYPYWHYFDVYPPYYVRLYYRGNDIPLPFHQDSLHPKGICQNWGIFQVINNKQSKGNAQLSLMRDGDTTNLYACYSIPTKDAANNRHVLTVGVDLGPAIEATNISKDDILDEIEISVTKSPNRPLSQALQTKLRSAVGLLNIGFIQLAMEHPPKIVCPWNTLCPQPIKCEGRSADEQYRSPITELRLKVVRH